MRQCARCGRDFCGDCTIVLQGRVICSGCKDEEVRDRLSGVGDVNPLADFRSRFEAWFIDWLISAVAGYGVQRASTTGTWGTALFLWGIYVLYEALVLNRRGQTIGKICLHIKVVSGDGAPLQARQAWLRAIVRGVFFSLLAAIDYFPALLSTERTCIHDLLAGTRVVKDRAPG